jgi:electron transport complex protein RnfB
MKEGMNRRSFLGILLRLFGGAAILGSGIALGIRNGLTREKVWQIDPAKCTQCGRCETSCVLVPSAVKCVHAYAVCGYCDLCSGYLKSGADLDTAAENHLCPTAAIKRSYVEDPYYEYIIDEDLCIACARCVKGCAAFGNGALFLQIKQDLCVHCSRCSIAAGCPAGAIKQVPAETPYLIKGDIG